MEIYADFNATTPLSEAAKKGLIEATEYWGNPSSAHRVGRKSLELIEKARAAVAEMVGAEARNIVFTSGGSEANTLALLGSFWETGPEFRIVTSKIEHSSVRDTVNQLQKLGATVKYLPVLPNGELDLAGLELLLNEFRPHLVTLMTANNETGVLFDIERLAAAAHLTGAKFHTDAVQAFGKIPNQKWRSADLVSISAHKIYGPKGIGALVVRSGTKLVPTHFGGSQEIKRRGGTENTPGILAFGAAAREIPVRIGQMPEVEKCRDHFEDRLLRALSEIEIPSKNSPRIPNTSNVRFIGIPNEILLGALDMDGVYVSAGSACSSGSISPSHVLLEMGMEAEAAREVLRFSWGTATTMAQVDITADFVIKHVQRIRERRTKR